jgi:hypothetical protein
VFEGRGGNLFINAEVFLADPASFLSASGSLGITGTVTSLTGSVVPLPQTFMSVAALLPARCATRWREGKASSLVLSGPDGLPADSSGVLPSPLMLEERLAADPAGISAPPQPRSPARFAFLKMGVVF